MAHAGPLHGPLRLPPLTPPPSGRSQAEEDVMGPDRRAIVGRVTPSHAMARSTWATSCMAGLPTHGTNFPR